MKPPTVFLGEMTDPEVEAFLRDHRTVIVPTGSTEQHGPHGPLLTDVFVPVEVARRVAPRTGALVAPSLNYGAVVPARRLHRRRPPADRDVHGPHRGRRRRAGDDGLPPDRVPERPLRQHLRDRLRLRDRRRAAARRRARVPGQLLGRHDRRRGRRVLRPDGRPAREPGRDLGRHGHRSGPRRHRPGQRGDAAVPRGGEPGARSTPPSSSRRRGPSTGRPTAGRGAMPASPAPSTASATSRS